LFCPPDSPLILEDSDVDLLIQELASVGDYISEYDDLSRMILDAVHERFAPLRAHNLMVKATELMYHEVVIRIIFNMGLPIDHASHPPFKCYNSLTRLHVCMYPLPHLVDAAAMAEEEELDVIATAVVEVEVSWSRSGSTHVHPLREGRPPRCHVSTTSQVWRPCAASPSPPTPCTPEE